MHAFFRSLFPVVLLTVTPAHAQQARQVILKVSAGTGFVVNRDGDIVTNAHVVKACRSIRIRTASGDLPAALLTSDPEHDLALLRAPAASGMQAAPLRWNGDDLQTGDPVVIMGYPGQAGIEGRYQFKKTTIGSLTGPRGESQWLQLASVAQHGNSGGPVLDTTGNVIGVLSGMALTYRVNNQGGTAPKLVGQSDIAVPLPALRDFLRRHRVAYSEATSGGPAYDDTVLESNAHQFIVPVQCIQG